MSGHGLEAGLRYDGCTALERPAVCGQGRGLARWVAGIRRRCGLLRGYGRPLAPARPAATPWGRAGRLRRSSVSLFGAFGVRATPWPSGSHPARIRPAPLLPRARLAFQGCWLQRAFSYRGPRPIRSPEGRTGFPIAGISRGAFGCPPRGNCRLAWRHPGCWEPVPVPSIRTGSLPADGLGAGAGAWVQLPVARAQPILAELPRQ